jgi:oxygen-independent coproporphyrinogen-3 oxidase
VGNYFVANYPPFSFWRSDQIPRVEDLLATAPNAAPQLGLYVHIPFCRKRCDFCYFRVYTDKDSRSVRRYLDGLLTELAAFCRQPYLRGRKPAFVYFGGGTPSYLSIEQLTYLFAELQEHLPWAGAEEVTFECEPGTLPGNKIDALRDLGVTRLSLGVENFDGEILALNNRAHGVAEIDTAFAAARAAGFHQVNIDLIAGMVGETDANWRRCIERTAELLPDSVTIYQMEIPYNTTVYQRLRDGQQVEAPIADWAIKRRWVDEAFRSLAAAGYRPSSAYTMVRGEGVRFLYRDSLWHGADLLGIGVASFSHLGGCHFQNQHDFEPYLEAVERGALPITRALRLSDDERLIREFVLQLKTGAVERPYFRARFGVDPAQRFSAALREHQRAGFLQVAKERIALTRPGLLQVDTLLESFFLERHQHARYA